MKSSATVCKSPLCFFWSIHLKCVWHKVHVPQSCIQILDYIAALIKTKWGVWFSVQVLNFSTRGSHTQWSWSLQVVQKTFCSCIILFPLASWRLQCWNRSYATSCFFMVLLCFFGKFGVNCGPFTFKGKNGGLILIFFYCIVPGVCVTFSFASVFAVLCLVIWTLW